MKLKLYSWNVNGLRAAGRNGFLDWLGNTNPDIICLQEVKAHQKDLPDNLKNYPGYFSYFSEATKKGYAGTAIITKLKPKKIITKIGLPEFDNEGRFLFLEFDKFYLFNTYFPHTQHGLARLDFKIKFNQAYLKFIKPYLKKSKPLILTGDFNVAHQEIDLKNPKGNTENPGFTAPERAFADELIKTGWVDTFRELHPNTIKYSWWSYRFAARKRGIGWRIDYFFIPKKFFKIVKAAEIHDQIMGSDHCPVSIDIKL